MVKKLLYLFFGLQIQAHAQTIYQNAQVLDVNKMRVLNGYDVWVKDGKIEALKKHSDKNNPPNYQLKDCAGQFILPGLGDAHVHFFQSGSLLPARMLLICVNSILTNKRSIGHIRIIPTC